MSGRGEIVRPILNLIPQSLRTSIRLGVTSNFSSGLKLLATPAQSLEELENRLGPLLMPLVKKTPAAFLSLAFVYLAACNFDPFWMAHESETEVITVPQEPTQLQVCNPLSNRDSRSVVRNHDSKVEQKSKTEAVSSDPCLPLTELSLSDRPHELPYAHAPPAQLI